MKRPQPFPKGEQYTAFKMMDTHGVPFEVLVAKSLEWGIVLSIPEIYHDALRAGWTHKKIRSTIVEGIRDAEGEKMAHYVATLLDKYDQPVRPTGREWTKKAKGGPVIKRLQPFPRTKKFTAFKMIDTHGMPFEHLLVTSLEWGVTVPIPEIYHDARKAGWTHKKIRSTIVEGVREVSCVKLSQYVGELLDKYGESIPDIKKPKKSIF